MSIAPVPSPRVPRGTPSTLKLGTVRRTEVRRATPEVCLSGHLPDPGSRRLIHRGLEHQGGFRVTDKDHRRTSLHHGIRKTKEGTNSTVSPSTKSPDTECSTQTSLSTRKLPSTFLHPDTTSGGLIPMTRIAGY